MTSREAVSVVPSVRAQERELYPRDILAQLLPWLGKRQNLFVAGPRQAGKTSLLFLVMDHLRAQGVPDERIRYLDLEFPELRGTLDEGFGTLLSYLERSGFKAESPAFLLLDEVHLLQEPSNLLKLLADHAPQIQVIFTGSSSLQIRQKFTDSMAGRQVTFELLSLSFREFLEFTQRDVLAELHRKEALSRYLEKPQRRGENLDPVHRAAMNEAFEEYCRFGGYPAVALAETSRADRRLLESLVDVYVRRDLRDLMLVENPAGMLRLLRHLSAITAQLLNQSSVSNTVNLSRPTVSKYLFSLEQTFIVRTLSPYFTNRVTEQTKMPKVHFLDPGLRNHLLADDRPLDLRPDMGALVETFVFDQLIREAPEARLHFWRTKAGAEVDFVLIRDGLPIPIEVKFQRMKQPEVSAGLRSCIAALKPDQAYVLTRDFHGKVEHDACVVRFLPVWLA